MQNKKFNAGPIALTATYTTNLLNPATATGGVNGGSSSQYFIIQRIKITNVTGTAATARLYKDATGGNTLGKALCYDKSVPANDEVNIDFPGGLRIDAADFIVGGTGTAAALNVSFYGEVGVAG